LPPRVTYNGRTSVAHAVGGPTLAPTLESLPVPHDRGLCLSSLAGVAAWFTAACIWVVGCGLSTKLWVEIFRFPNPAPCPDSHLLCLNRLLEFGTSIRVYFVNHPGDTLTLDDAQWCLNTALYDYRGCSRSRGRLGSSGSWRRAGVPNNFAWEVPTFSTEAPCVVSGVACAPMLSFCRGLV
jgi:hypothetical protein